MNKIDWLFLIMILNPFISFLLVALYFELHIDVMISKWIRSWKKKHGIKIEGGAYGGIEYGDKIEEN